jgi:hypothetical protein
MTDHHGARNTGLTTDQIASPGATEYDGAQSEAQPQDPGREASSDFDEEAEPHAQLLEGEQMQSVVSRWNEIQANFVDEPRSAVQDADALVADLMQRLARMFAAERNQLESRWASGEEVSTEDLRQGLQRYRSFFERLLAA